MHTQLRPGQCTNRVTVDGGGWQNCANDAEPGKRLCATCALGRCQTHPAFEADNCPGCGTARKIS
jgi:hypothetical protein